MNNPMLCEHANEVPPTCTCSDDCYCKTHTCKNQEDIYYPKELIDKLKKFHEWDKLPKQTKKGLEKLRDGGWRGRLGGNL